MLEIAAGELPAERQQLGALDGDDQETVEEPVGEFGCGEIAQQLVFGDMADDPDVRVGGAQRRVAADRLQSLASHALRTTGDRVFPSRARTFMTCANSGSTTSRRLSVGASVSLESIGSRTWAISPSPELRPDTSPSPAKAGSARRARLRRGPRLTFAALAGGADEHGELVGVVAAGFDRPVGVAAGGDAERDEELDQQRHRVGLGVRLGADHELARRPVERGLGRRCRPAGHAVASVVRLRSRISVRFSRRAASSSSSASRSAAQLDLRGEQLLDFGLEPDDGLGCRRVRVLGGDFLAERPREPGLERADLLLRFARLVFGGLQLDPQRRGAQRGLAVQSGDEPRLDLGSGVAISAAKWLATNER